MTLGTSRDGHTSLSFATWNEVTSRCPVTVLLIHLVEAAYSLFKPIMSAAKSDPRRPDSIKPFFIPKKPKDEQDEDIPGTVALWTGMPCGLVSSRTASTHL